MLESLTKKSLETVNIRKLLRKKFIERLVVVLKGCLIVLFIVIALLGVQSARRSLNNSKEASSSFSASVKPSLDLLASPPQIENKPQDYSEIAKKSVFGQLGAAASQKPSDASQKASATTLPLTLIGTFISEGQEPYAIIEEQKKKTQDVFLVNDTIFGESKLVAIFADRVDISRGGKIETLTLDSAPDKPAGDTQGGVASMGNDEYIVEEGELDKALENLPQLLTQARAVPYFKEGRAIGLRLFAIKAGSLFEKIGLQNGDILKTVNGNSLADLSQAMQLFQKLKEERSISVVMERNATEKEFRYTIR